MGNFNKFDKGRDRGFGGGGRSFGGRPSGDRGGERSFGGRSDAPKQMFPAVCSQCGESCEIPFKPTGIHPVFCRPCFKNQGGQGVPAGRSSFSAPKFAPKSFGGGNFGGNGDRGASPAPSNAATKTQVDALNAKLDRILDILISTNGEEKPAVVDIFKSEALGAKTPKKVVAEKVKAPAKKAKGKKK